jgi:hypothetical protein
MCDVHGDDISAPNAAKTVSKEPLQASALSIKSSNNVRTDWGILAFDKT